MASLYQQSIPVMLKYLNNVSKILDKTVVYADKNGIEHKEILNVKLRDDMKP